MPRPTPPARGGSGHAAPPHLNGPETGKREQIARKADGKLALLVKLGGSWHEKLALLVMNDFDVFSTLHGFYLLRNRTNMKEVINFRFPISGPVPSLPLQAALERLAAVVEGQRPQVESLEASVCEQNTTIVRAFAVQSRGRNCYPAPDLVLGEPVFPQVFFSGGSRAQLFIGPADCSHYNCNRMLFAACSTCLYAYGPYGQFSKFHVCFCGLDSGNLKFETARTNKQHICF